VVITPNISANKSVKRLVGNHNNLTDMTGARSERLHQYNLMLRGISKEHGSQLAD
jgi:hypothetical protein